MGLPGYKIGETTNLSRRLKQLKVPTHATRVHTFRVPKRLAAEKAAHKLYPNLRVPQSEWFKISEQQMERVASFIRNRFTVEQVKPKVVTAQWPPGDLDSSYPSSSFKPASERCMPLEQPTKAVATSTNDSNGFITAFIGGTAVFFLIALVGIASTAYSEFAPADAPRIEQETSRPLQSPDAWL